MKNSRPLVQLLVLTTLAGSLALAFRNPDLQDDFMQIAQASLGSFWGLEQPRKKLDE